MPAHKKQFSKGFTLVELLVTISIIAILSTVGIVSFIGIRNKALDAKKKGDIDAIRKAYEQNFDPTENEGQGGYKQLNPAQFADGKIPTQPNNSPYPCPIGPGCAVSKNQGYLVTATLSDGTAYKAISNQGTYPQAQLNSCDPAGSLSNGLVGYWKMDDNFSDSSGNNNTGVNENGVTFASASDNTKGDFHQAGSFTGTSFNQRVKVTGSSALAPSQFSISFWVYPTYDTTTGWKGLITGAKGNGYDYGWRVIDYNNTARIQVKMAGGLETCWIGASLTRNDWSHVVAMYDQQNLKVYINGNEKCTKSAAGSINYSTADPPPDMYLGYAQSSFQGRIDDVRLYNRVLIPQEISILAGGCIAP